MNSIPIAGADESDVTITVCPDGPLLVRGAARILDPEGNPLGTDRATVALCRCGRTSIAPFCDSSHKKRRRP
ncbi:MULTISPECIES: CDGSH iron-sulfur domain-containing protein [Rhodococcus]|jgi:CDGSH-type Zn-finger protein|uniref:CDGSH iron-sulfur domain-containing protein n=1 Tax=Rhodococcus TaxID=1827 RepID=UPI0002F23ED0|nr:MULTISPECIES: CDGSH iron-sulfur domain-containing protein [Rhodococcus]